MGAKRLVAALVAVLGVVGCGSASRSVTSNRSAAGAPTSAPPGIPPRLASEARPIGRGVRFHPPATGPVIGGCRRPLGPRFGVHIEIFAADRVLLLPAGIGAVAPLSMSGGRISSAHCFGALTTLEPTGVVLVRRGDRWTVADLFRAWGQPLSDRRLASFQARPGDRVAAFVDGRRRDVAPGSIPLLRHSEIVLEVGPRVPPHAVYRFPPDS